jgi:phage terminase small subunit
LFWEVPATFTRRLIPGGLFLPSKKLSPAQNATKPSKAKVGSSPKKSAPVKKAPGAPSVQAPAPLAASKWRIASPGAEPATKDVAPEPEKALTPNTLRFVDEYLVDFNATQAYLRVFPHVKPTTASTEGCRLLGIPKVSELVAQKRAQLSARTGITAERALAHAWAIATADARELVEYLVGCCRHCHGEGFKWQRTVAEYNAEREKWQLGADTGKTDEPFDEKGGVGFDPRREPNPDCPECFGKGNGRTHINDTRKLSVAAAALYAGVKTTKEGIELKMHSKLDALEKVFKHLGLYEKDNTQKVDPISSLLATIAKSSIPVVKAPGDE